MDWKYDLFTLLKISIFHMDEIKTNDFGWKFKKDSAHDDLNHCNDRDKFDHHSFFIAL